MTLRHQGYIVLLSPISLEAVSIKDCDHGVPSKGAVGGRMWSWEKES